MYSDSALPPGSYETPITSRIQERIAATKQSNPAASFGIAEAPKDKSWSRYASAVTHYFAEQLYRALSDIKKPTERVALLNQLAGLLDSDEGFSSEELLYSVQNFSAPTPPLLPDVPLTQETLFTNSPGETNLNHEIRRELETADRVDLLCAFIKQSGLNVISEGLTSLAERKIPLRVITSTYCGATEDTAIKRLTEEFGAEVKVCYEGQRTRLHAKAWLFRRNSGFDTAFIGSSNLSHSALIDGMEWNVRTSSTTTPDILRKFLSAFETYWNDPQFELFHPATDGERLTQALAANRGGPKNSPAPLELSGIEVTPYPHQKEMLEALEAERQLHGRHKNLLVAATGTGKTIVSALDYKQLQETLGRRPTLLFIAHREEILRQSQRAFREVLAISDFGELLNGQSKPQRWTHVFASIQSLNQSVLESLPRNHFDVIIVDEFHHAEARTYRRALDYFTPRELLGLTATPERGDGKSVQGFFDYRTAYELRLWDALSLQLLCPLHYYGVSDGTDLSSLTWRRGKKDYDQNELSEFYIKAGEKRTRFILNQLEEKSNGLDPITGLGFCVSVTHARYMAEQFNLFGVPAAALDGSTPSHERKETLRKLQDGDISFVFAVDLFNEGLDIPCVNTLLLLRPTQSPVIFLQQLGRGLRRTADKSECVVLDFIGQQHQDFDFEQRYRALTGKRGKRLVSEIEGGFPTAPPGSNISLDRAATEEVLKHVKRVATRSARQLKTLIREVGTTSLSQFLTETGLSLVDIYRPNKASWSLLTHDAGLGACDDDTITEQSLVLRRVAAFLHIDDLPRINAYKDLLTRPRLNLGEESDTTGTTKEMLYARMLVLNVWGTQRDKSPATLKAALEQLRQSPSFRTELVQLLDILAERTETIPKELNANGGDGVLFSHATYSLAELIGALDTRQYEEIQRLPGEGVKHFPDIRTDLLLVTLKKDDTVSDTTNYRDFPISPTMFHWESQSRTTLDSATGQRYLHHKERGDSILLATRFTNKNDVGLAQAYTLLGNVDYVSHRGEKPIQINWELERPMPTRLYRQGRTVA